MVKNLKNIYSLDGLIIKKKNLQIIQVINMLRVFSSLRFFKIDYYPFGYDKFLKFYNDLVKFSIYKSYVVFLKGFNFYFKQILNKNLFLKKKLGYKIKYFLTWYQKNIIRVFGKLYLKKYKSFLQFKFRFKKLKKVIYLKKHKFGNRVKKTKKQIYRENIKMKFFSNLIKNKKNLQIIHHYIKNRYTKSLKRKHMYLKKNKKNNSNHLRKIFSDNIIYRKIKKKRKLLYKKLRINFKGNFMEKKESALKFFKILYKDKSKKKIKWLLKRRKKKFIRKYFLIKKYKRIVTRRKKRTGILHFRMYYSNYYITLTDLSHNVIFSCSAGSVSETNNKKTKMSNVISMPIFYRLIFFLRAFKIRNLKFVFRNRIDKIFFSALHFFKKRGYKIKSFSFVQKAAHHLGQRKQKPRRI